MDPRGGQAQGTVPTAVPHTVGKIHQDQETPVYSLQANDTLFTVLSLPT